MHMVRMQDRLMTPSSRVILDSYGKQCDLTIVPVRTHRSLFVGSRIMIIFHIGMTTRSWP